MASKKVLEHYLRQLRLIEEHREKWCIENVRRHYKDLNKDLQEFLGVEYAKLAKDDKLTYEILHAKGQYARFMEEVEKRTRLHMSKVVKDIEGTVELMYGACFVGMFDAVQNSATFEELKINLKGLRAVTPDVIKNVVQNGIMDKALEKNYSGMIYEIKQEIGIGLAYGDRMSTMARRLSDKLEQNYKKSVRIARTECHRVREAGYQDASERISQKLKDIDSDYVMVKQWRTMQDLSVRPYRMKGKKGAKTFVMAKGPDHVKMHGVVVLVDDLFDLGDGNKAKAPGQSGVAGHDINCRCRLSRDLMLKSEYEKLSGKKFVDDDPAKPYEQKEQVLLDNKDDLTAKKDDLELQKLNLESKQYTGIWKDPVTPADYAAKKSSIAAKRQYYIDDITAAQNRTGKYASAGFYSDADIANIINRDKKYLDMLDDFEAQGKAYLKITKKLDDIVKEIADTDDQIAAVRQKIMKLKGIDLDKLQGEIDDLANQINVLASANKNLTLKSKVSAFTEGQLEEAYEKVTGVKPKTFHLFADDSVEDLMNLYLPSTENQTAFKKELKKLVKNNPEEAKKLKKLQKQLADKSDELEKIRKRYGLADDAFSQARKDGAYWFTDSNGGAKAADDVLRDKCGAIWKKATAAQKKTAYEYTRSFHKYNEPLRGIEYGTSKFVGVGKIDLEDIGVSTGYGMKKGEVKKLIDDLTDIIDKSSYDFDYWVQRGTGYSGMDKFFNIDPGDFSTLTEKEMRDKLLGTTPTEFGFMSTGVSKGRGLNLGGEGITLNIYAPKGTKMLYCEPFSAFGNGDGKAWDGISKQSSIGHEAEMLLQRNTKFRVTRVEKSGSRWFIDMDVISQDR